MIKKTRKIGFNNLLSRLVENERELNKLPPLSPLDKAKLDNGRAIDHLYYSSKIEGSHLTSDKINKAIHGQTLSPSER